MNHSRQTPAGRPLALDVARRLRTTILLLPFSLATTADFASAEVRIKDIVNVEGVRPHKLMGFGLVTGLNGTGGKAPITREFALNLLERFGVTSDPLLRARIRTDAQQKTDNMSVVTVTAEAPAFARPGSRIDVTVSAYDDASSLQGGTLISTPLIAYDEVVYAMASGPVSVGGFSFSGQAASVTKNHPTTGRIPNGATVERAIGGEFVHDGVVKLLLREADFETARRIARAINAEIPAAAATLDSRAVQVLIPPKYADNPVAFVGRIGNLLVQPDNLARVVINERTGTVIMGENVRIAKVAITHANLSVITSESPQVSQPEPFSRGGETVVVPRTQIEVNEDNSSIQVVDETVTVRDLARALNALGVTPRDLSSIFQALKEAGALHAQLEIE